MKLIFHIVRKDAARLRPLWWAWLGLQVAKLAWAGVMLHGSVWSAQRFGRGGLERMDWALGAFDAVLVYLMAAWLVLEDAPTNARHFVRTRPVSRGLLLGAKVAGAVGLIALPSVLLWLPWWLYCGFTTIDVMAEAGVVVAGRALLVLAAFFVASLVDSFRRLFLWTPVALGALVVAMPMPLVWMIMRSVGARGPGHDPELLGLWQTRFLLAGLLLVGGAALAVAWQFWRRRSREVLIGAALWLGGVLATTMLAPWNFWPVEDEWAEWRAERVSGVEVSLERAVLWPPLVGQGGPSSFDAFRLGLGWRAEPTGDWEIRPLRTRTKLAGDGIGWGADGRWVKENHYPEDWFMYVDLEDVLRRVSWAEGGASGDGGSDPVGAGEVAGAGAAGWGRFEWSLNFGRATAPRFAPEDKVRVDAEMLLARVEFDVSSPRLAAQGAWSFGSGRRIFPPVVEHLGQRKWVRVADCRRARLFDRRWAEFLAPLEAFKRTRSLDADGLLLLSTPVGQAPGRDEIVERRWLSRSGPVAGGVALRQIVATGIGGEADITDITDGERLEGLSVVAVERRETARFFRTVSVDRLQVEHPEAAP